MQQHPDYTRKRIRQMAGRLRGRIYSQTRPVDQLLVSGPVGRISFDEAQKLKCRPAKIGQQFGPAWSTFWFRARAKVPPQWRSRRVDLLWVSFSEATLWIDGQSVQGLNHDPTAWDQPTRPDAVLIEKARGGETVEFQVEMAANRLFGNPLGEKHYKSISLFVLDQCDLALFDPEAWDLYWDYQVLADLEAELSKEGGASDRAWAGELLAELNRVCNIYDEDDRATWKAASAILRKLYLRRNADAVLNLSAIGHAHIDTAWLWPLEETWRKCTRTFSSVVSYCRDYPELKFGCSQAAQYAMVKERNPGLYRRIKAAAARGQFVPVGGTWVEPDCNIPSGESLVRQFLCGQRFFEKEFGARCGEFWQPDVFGYNGQLPQIMQLAGIDRFVTQKLSWNKFNKPHHHTFTWQGIDGSEVLAHFPPADTYNSSVKISELRRVQRDYKDHDRSKHALMLFGHGDGGGGPTKAMIETLRRARDLQGLPRTTIRSSDEFFSLLEEDCTDRATMVGELYFELHRGTYTTHAATKRGNRRCEELLHDVECLSALAGAAYPRRELDRLWKLLLVNQFHDILPGSSITMIYEDAARDYSRIGQSAGALRDKAMTALLGPAARGGARVVNTTSFARAQVVDLGGGKLAFAQAPSYGIGELIDPPDTVSVRQTPGRVTLENAHLRAVLSRDGRLISLVEKSTGRQSLAGPGNVLELYDDRPIAFDAWDVDPYHAQTRRECEPARLVAVRAGKLRAQVVYERKIGGHSFMTQTVRLDAAARRLEFHCEVDWRESHKMLKVAFPVNVRAMNATYEMQFGCVERPTHYNTSYDLAKFEVPGHHWADLSEHGFGVALLSESKYGFSTFGQVMRMSLLRSSKSPDPQADMGRHEFAYAIMPHAGGWREAGVVGEGYRFNCPLLVAAGAARPRSLASVDDPNLVIDTIKKAEDSQDLIVRLYECHGARGTARLRLDRPFEAATFCNILEDELGPAKIGRGLIQVPYGPFQIITLKVRP